MRVIRYKTDEGTVTALEVKTGRKFVHVLPMEATGSGLVVRKLPLAEGRWMTEVAGYPVARALDHFRSMARFIGCTMEAGRVLGIEEAPCP